MAAKNQKGSAPVPIDPALLDWAEYWYPVSWKGVLAGGVITAVGACATIAFLLLQWRTTSIREEQSEWRTVSLESQTAQANAALGMAQADISKAHAQAAEAMARAAEANQKAEEERLARVKIEARIAPRSITQEQQNELTERLKNFEIRETTLMASPSTSENEWTVRWLGAPLAAAGWNIKILPSTSMASVLFPRGIIVYGPWLPDGEPYDPDKVQTGVLAPADRLARSLMEFGIEATALPMIDVPPGCIRIIVNSR